jgi:dienelactone hydrolase
MPEPARPDAQTFDRFVQAYGAALRKDDAPPASRDAWAARRKALRERMFAAMGGIPAEPAPLDVQEKGTLKRDGYHIEKVVIRTRPGVWMTSSLYVPEGAKKAPAVLAVHGHWAGARRDPVVQARCLGLVKLGFVVLAVDAFGAGERYTKPASGTYHGALFGASLWPAGLSLLGMQVYDNRRAVDYLCTRPEVDPARIGVTGASGGGNQTMYAGALDERLAAVVPVCSVGNYQAYLKAACCVCEVLPGALRFTEEGDVLGLVAPRALMVVNASKDSFQFSVGEAEKSLARAKAVYGLLGAEEKVKHAVFESPHAYNQAMREAMYGWMTRWLKGEGDGKPIPEPKHEVDKPEDLACFADLRRPADMLFPPSFAAREARKLLAPFAKGPPAHKEAWEAQAVVLRGRLREEVFGDFPAAREDMPAAFGEPTEEGGRRTTPLTVEPEAGMPLAALVRFKPAKGKVPACVVLHLDGKDAALKAPEAQALVEAGFSVYAPDLRATGAAKPAGDAVRDAPDHNSAEHAVWVGRPLLGQWAFDVRCLFDFLEKQPGLDGRLALLGLGQAGLVALCAAALDDRVAAAAVVDAPLTLVGETGYPSGTRMGLLAPGLLKVGDVPQLAALAAPRPLLVAGTRELPFTQATYRLLGAGDRLRLAATSEGLAGWLARP